MNSSITLENPSDFFEEVTRPNYNDFFDGQSSFSRAFALVMGLFNINEWIFVFNKSDVEGKFDKPFSSSSALWQEVESRIPEAKYIRDLSNASKHVKLTLRPSTKMNNIENAVIRSSAYGVGAYGKGRYSARSFIIIDNGHEVYLDDCAKKLFGFWEQLIKEFYPTQQTSIELDAGVRSTTRP